MTPTQTQIEVAAKAIQDHFGGSFDEMAKAALTAAAGVENEGSFERHSVDFQEGIREGTVATIERCAQVVREFFLKEKPNHGDTMPLAVALIAAIRDLKE